MSTDRDDSASDVPKAGPDEESRFDRGLRVVFILLILLAILSGYATRPTIHAPMRNVLRDAQIVEVVRQQPSWERAELEWSKRPLLVRHRSAVASGTRLMNMESVFDGGGLYLGTRSMIGPSRHEARTTAGLAEALEQNHERYEALEEIPDEFSLPIFWTRIDEEFDLRWISAFRAFPVLFYSDIRTENPPTAAIVLHLWCRAPANDVEEAQACPQARRVVLDMISNEIIRNDYLL